MVIKADISSEVCAMCGFQATHKLVAPAGEVIPVMLLSRRESVRYLVVTPEEYEEGSTPIYEWHPSEGVTYKGFKLDGLEILPLRAGEGRRSPTPEPLRREKQSPVGAGFPRPLWRRTCTRLS